MKNLDPKKSLLIILFLIGFIFLGVEFGIVSDFYVYLTAASNLFSHENLYHELYGIPAVFFYMGNPFITLLFYPLSQIPFQLSALIWKFLSILSFYRIWKIIEISFAEIKSTIQRRNLWLTLSFIISFFVIYANLHLVQLTIIMFYLAFEGLYQITQRNNFILGALLMSIAIATKVSPIVFIPYLLYRNYFKATLSILLLCSSYWFIPALFIGWEKNMELWSEWWSIIDPEATIFDMNNRKNHGISALLSTLFIANIQDNIENLTHRRHLIGLSKETVIYMIYGVRLALVALTLYFLRTKPFAKATNQFHQFWEWSYLFLVIPLLFPQQRTYNFIFLMPAIAYLVFNFIHHKQRIERYKLKLSIFIFSSVVLNLELLLGQFRKYYWHHKTITYAALLLLILLLLIKPLKHSDQKA